MGASIESARPPGPDERDDRPVDARTRVLQVLLALAIVESFVHYADNTLRYDDYVSDDPPLIGSLVKQWVIPISWVLFTAAAIIGYRHYRAGRWPQAAAWLGAYSVSGLISLAHYTDISPSDLSAFQNTFVGLDVLLGVLVLAFAFWTALRPPSAPASPAVRV
jgi:hypothetical protein